MNEKRKPDKEENRTRGPLEILTEWKTQLASLVLAPFIGIGFAFDFLLRARDFPELASAMWGVLAFCVGMFFFFLCTTCVALTVSLLGTQKRDQQIPQWIQCIAQYTLLLAVIGTCLLVGTIAILALTSSIDGFGHFVSPYVKWLNAHVM